LAADVYAKLLETFPRSGLLLSDLAAMKAKSGHVHEAQSLFEKAYAVDPKDPIIALNLGRLARLVGDLDAAERWMTKGVELEPTNTATLLDLATLAMRKGAATSLPAWDRYLAANERHPDDPAWRTWGQQMRDAIAKGLDDRGVQDFAQGLLDGGNGAVALPLIAWLQTRNPADARPGWMRAAVLEREGQPALAAEQLLAIAGVVEQGSESAGGIEPVNLWWNLGRNLQASGQGTAAVTWLAKVEAKSPDRPALQYLLGNVHASLGHAESARHYWEQCVEKPNNAEYVRWCQANLARGTSRPPP